MQAVGNRLVRVRACTLSGQQLRRGSDGSAKEEEAKLFVARLRPQDSGTVLESAYHRRLELGAAVDGDEPDHGDQHTQVRLRGPQHSAVEPGFLRSPGVLRAQGLRHRVPDGNPRPGFRGHGSPEQARCQRYSLSRAH